jgi:hypothetical protein
VINHLHLVRFSIADPELDGVSGSAIGVGYHVGATGKMRGAGMFCKACSVALT